MILLSQAFTSLEKQQVLYQASAAIPPNDRSQASYPGFLTSIKPEVLQAILTIEKHKVSSLSILEPAFQLFLSLPGQGPP
jgi:hypothetical protein